jgi:hypothetical protein
MKMLAKKLFALCREFPWSKKWQTPCPLRQPDSSDGANRLLHFQFRKGNMKLRKLFAPIARATAAGSKPVAKMLMQKLFAPITGVIVAGAVPATFLRKFDFFGDILALGVLYK